MSGQHILGADFRVSQNTITNKTGVALKLDITVNSNGFEKTRSTTLAPDQCINSVDGIPLWGSAPGSKPDLKVAVTYPNGEQVVFTLINPTPGYPYLRVGGMKDHNLYVKSTTDVKLDYVRDRHDMSVTRSDNYPSVSDKDHNTCNFDFVIKS